MSEALSMTRVVMVLAFQPDGGEDVPRLFSTQEKADAWLDAQPDDVYCVVTEVTIDDPDEQHRSRRALS